ncbi:TPA: hypothetical protein ACSP1Y_004709 [Aeromonas hydrophila]|uniref:hypothetical protein n=1 Tax=Aeromonas TaxID=642 RepID=UPI002B49D829|nr:hypothetical protein [Aeromonas caviae]
MTQEHYYRQTLPSKEAAIKFKQHMSGKLTKRTTCSKFMQHVAQYYDMSYNMVSSLFAYCNQYGVEESVNDIIERRMLLVSYIPWNYSDWEEIMQYYDQGIYGNDRYNAAEWKIFNRRIPKHY